MRIHLNEDVLTASLNRIRRLYDEFEHIAVTFSGGKDSTVAVNLALQVAEERGRLPLNVIFLDQEAEWDATIEYVRIVMHDPRVKPWWFQIPIKLFNATSTDDPWLYCWKPGAEWIRPKEPDSIHDNILGTDRFTEGLDRIPEVYFNDKAHATITGVRTEESPARKMGLTSYACYKDITWGSVRSKKKHHYIFHPLYDWTYIDVWKAIHEHGWPYCKLYDYMYQYGVPIRNMRVSNVHHETAVKTLTFLQEIEPETWDKVTARLAGVNAVNQARELYQVPKELPWMFSSWREYRDHLLENLVRPEHHDTFRRQFVVDEKMFVEEHLDAVRKMHVAAILVNDYHGTKRTTFMAANGQYMKNKGSRSDKFSTIARPTGSPSRRA